jgi:hypothetical protein
MRAVQRIVTGGDTRNLPGFASGFLEMTGQAWLRESDANGERCRVSARAGAEFPQDAANVL